MDHENIWLVKENAYPLAKLEMMWLTTVEEILI